MMKKHKRLVAQTAPQNRIAHDEDGPRVAVTFLLPKTLAKAVCEAALASDNLLYPAVIICDHLVLARPRGLMEAPPVRPKGKAPPAKND